MPDLVTRETKHASCSNESRILPLDSAGRKRTDSPLSPSTNQKAQGFPQAFRPTNALPVRGRRTYAMQTITANHSPRKTLWPHTPRPWTARPTRTPAGEHYLRPIIADRVKQATSRAHVNARLRAHISAALSALPRGRAGAVRLGRDTAVRLLTALGDELASPKPRRFSGGAVAFCEALGVPVGIDAASAALRLIAALTPILQRTGRYQWTADLATLKVCQRGDPRLEFVLSHVPVYGQQRVTSDPELTQRESEPLRSPGQPLKKHARAVVGLSPPAAEDHRLERQNMGGLGCAPSAPAETADASPGTSPASAASALKMPMTHSAWHQAIPHGVHVQRLRHLLTGQGVTMNWSGTAREVTDRLASEDGRWTSRRERWGLVRALATLRRRGLVLHDGGVWRLPELALHDALEFVGLDRPRPSDLRPTPAQTRDLTRRGVDTRGLSRPEASAVSYRLFTRRAAGQMTYRQAAALGQIIGQRPGEMSRALVDGASSEDFETIAAGFRRQVNNGGRAASERGAP